MQGKHRPPFTVHQQLSRPLKLIAASKHADHFSSKILSAKRKHFRLTTYVQVNEPGGNGAQIH